MGQDQAVQAARDEAIDGDGTPPAGWHSEWCMQGTASRVAAKAQFPALQSWSLAEGVARHAGQRPHALALAAGGQSWTYAQLARDAAGLAVRWRTHPHWPVHAAQAPRVGILASRSAEACLAALAAAWSGATYVPLGLNLPEERLVQVLQRCRLSALVTDAQGAALLSPRVLQAAPDLVEVLSPQAPHFSVSSRVAWQPSHDRATQVPTPPQRLAPDEAAYILFTSGSTGEPKGVVVPVRAVRHYVQSMPQWLGLVFTDRVLDVFELSFDVSVHNLFCTWEAGASLHLLPAAQVMNAVGFVREQRLTVWNSVPSLPGLLRQVKALSPGAMPSLRLSTFGGEPLSRSIVEAWREAAPRSRICNLYGPTEATVTCLGQTMDHPLPLRAGSDVLAIGQPLPGMAAQVVDALGRPVPDGTPGELMVSGVQLASGYLDAPEQTALRFVQRGGRRWLRTGDRAVCDEEGRYHCLGRMDHQVKVRGYRIELEDVEVHLREVLSCDLVAAVPWPVRGGAAHGLVAFAGPSDVEEGPAMKAMRMRLPPYMVPTRLVTLACMPLSPNGKVDRSSLRRMLEAGAW